MTDIDYVGMLSSTEIGESPWAELSEYETCSIIAYSY